MGNMLDMSIHEYAEVREREGESTQRGPGRSLYDFMRYPHSTPQLLLL